MQGILPVAVVLSSLYQSATATPIDTYFLNYKWDYR